MSKGDLRVLMSTDTVGGVWSYAIELARGLCEQGARVDLAALGTRPSAGQTAAAAAIPGLALHARVCRLEWMADPWEELAAAGDWLLDLAHRVRPHIVHLNHYCHGHLPWPAPVLMVAHSCVYSWHRWVRQRQPAAGWRRYRREVRLGLQAADLVVAPTRAMLADARHFYGPFRQAVVVANGRRPQDFPPAPKQPRIVCAGRLWDEGKNVMALAEVAAELPWPIEIIGDPQHPSGGRALFANVLLPGPLPQAQLARRLAEAAIYALPARYEPFGLSALEAGLAGCALVLGDIPSLREVWGDAALFVPPHDHRSLAATLQRLIGDAELRRHYGTRARARARQFTAERMVRAYRRLYRRLRRRDAAKRRADEPLTPCSA